MVATRRLICKFIFKFSDLCAKEKIIADMRMTLEEQEQTQIEQDQVLEAKLEESNRLVLGNLSMEREQGSKIVLNVFCDSCFTFLVLLVNCYLGNSFM